MADDSDSSNGTPTTTGTKKKGRNPRKAISSAIAQGGRSLASSASASADRAAEGAREAGERAAQMAEASAQRIPSMKRGGKVRKTGLHLLHRGEHVVPVRAKHGRSKMSRGGKR